MHNNMKHLRSFNESKPAGAPEFHDSKAPDAHGRFRDLSIKDLAAWLIKTRKKDVKKISSSLTQQIVFNRNDDPEYAEKMEKTRQEVYKQLGRTDLMDSKQIDNNMKYIKTFNEAKAKPGPDAYETGLDDKEVESKKDQMKKQAKMDDDDAAAYKEMPGDEEARESGKVKTSKHVKSYHEFYGDDEANESVNKSIITEKQLKGLDGIDSKTPLTKISDTQKLNIIQGTGNNISFKVPKGFNRNFWQVFSKGKIKKKKSLSGDIVYYLPGKFIDSPNFKSEKDLINGVDWESVEQTRRFNESLQLTEGTMSDIHQLAGEVKSEDEFVKKFFKEYGAKIKKSSDSVEWVKSLYKDTVDESIINEGQFSWITQDTGDQIGSQEQNTIDVYMYDNQGNWWYEKGYEGYGEFGGMDYYELLAKMNGYSEEDLKKSQKMRDIGIDLAFGKIKTKDKKKKTLFPALVTDPRYNWKRHDFTQEAESDPNQSWYQEPEFDDEDEYDDYYESVVNEDEEKKQSTDRTPLDDDAMETGLKKKTEETGVPIGIIRAVARRGLAAWKTGHRPGATQQQWAYARVNSFLTKQPGTWGGADGDLAKEVRDGGHDKKLKKA